MNDSGSSSDLLNDLAHVFAQRCRRGEHPPLTEYTDRYPELAAEIRDLFPALAVMEELGSVGAPPTDPYAGPSQWDARLPEQMGEYQILREVARGGMGIVYEAVQESLGRHVALKVLPRQSLTHPTHLERFRREAKAVARLHHTNIVPVFGVGEHEGVHFFAMQFINGQGLESVLEEVKKLRSAGSAVPVSDNPVEVDLSAGIAQSLVQGFTEPALQPPGPAVHTSGSNGSTATLAGDHSHLRSAADVPYFRSVAQLGLQVAEALAYAHQQGVLHRDIKPSNLLLDTQGTVWITDFGLAKAEGTDDLTSPGDIVGTLRYMAPERFQGQCDSRSDVYSLGLTLYELLSLRPAFAASERAQLIDRLLHDRPARPRALDPRIPRDLEMIVLKAMARDPGERYPTAAALAEDLRCFLTDRPILARRTPLWERTWRWCKRNPAVASLTTLVAALLVVGLGVLGVSHAQITKALEQKTQANDDLARALQREQRALYFQRMALTEREQAANNGGRATELLEACPLHLRGWEWHYLKRRPHQEPLTFRGHSAWVTGVAFSPDGKLVASASSLFSGALGEVKIWDRTTGKEVHRLLGHAGPAAAVAFSPDGKLLASAGWDRTVKVWDVARGKELHTLRGHTEYVSGVAFSPDGHLLASGSGDRTVVVWDAVTFQKLHTLHGHTRGLYGVCFSPDSRRLASAGYDETARLWDPATGDEVHTLRGHAGPVMGVAFNRDGKLLASAGFDGTMRLWDPASGQHLRTIQATNLLVTSVAFSADGKRLAAGSAEKAVRLWDVETGEEALTLWGHDDMVTSVAFSPDGQQLASASMDRTVRVWDAAPVKAGPEVLTLRGHTQGVFGVAFRPDGQRLATASFDETVKLWDATTGEEVLVLRGHKGPVRTVAFSAAGRLLVSADFAGRTHVWEAATGRKVRSFRSFAGTVALSPDGKRLATVMEGGIIDVWDMASGKEEVSFRGHAAPVIAITFSPDGQRLATASWDDTTKVWDATTGQALFTLRGHSNFVQSVVFSDDGKRLATASWDKTAKVWDAATGKELLTLRGHEDRLFNVAFSPDGKRLATSGWDNTVRIWDAATRKEVATLRGHTGDVLSVAFSPDGKRLASASGYRGKGEVKIWDATLWHEKPRR